jgi:hypothetical protein
MRSIVRLVESVARRLENLSKETGIPQVTLVEWAINSMCQAHKKRPQVSLRALFDEFSSRK